MPSLPQVSSAFSALLQAEVEETHKRKLSEVSWFADVFRIRASTIPRVFRPVLVITLWSTLVAVADLVYGTDLGLTNNVVPLLSVVVGLLLVFRNSTAYARWQEGRTLFSNMSNGVRNLARIMWISIGAAVYSQGRLNSVGERVPYQTGDYGEDEKKEKIAAVRMLVGLVIAAKHHVRSEFGMDYEDLRAVLPHQLLERFKKQGYGYGAIDADYLPQGHASLANKASMTSLGTSTSAAGAPDATSPLLSQRVYDDETVIIHKLEGRPTLPLPIVIAHRLQLYFAKCRAQGLLESVGPAGYNAMTTALSSLVSEFAGMERLLTLPLPIIYGVHLKQTVTAYLMVLPLVLVDTTPMTWKMIPFVTLISWLLMGIEEIALQIEQPFGFDASDLPLDLMCAELRNEVEQIIARLKEAPEDATPLF